MANLEPIWEEYLCDAGRGGCVTGAATVARAGTGTPR